MYWHWMLLSFFLSTALSPLVARMAAAFGIVDEPGVPRKVHKEPVPLLGGLAIFISLGVTLILALVLTNRLTASEINASHYVGFLVGGAMLMLGGFLDDTFTLKPRLSMLFPIMAALAAIAGGVEVTKLTNPLGGVILLEPWQSNVLVFVWLLVVMYVTKLLDGLDGLSTSVVSVGALAIVLLSLSAAYYQPDVALFASIGLGVLLGFLVWNWSPAKIFLGEGGSTFVGYLLGVLAVVSGGKLATALLVLGIPILDLIWTILRRARGGAKAIVSADRKHLHHRLFDLGWSQPRIVFLYASLALVFGVGALFLQSGQKILALAALVVLMIAVAVLLTRRSSRGRLP
ncbi:TPA: hypothetical protein DDZ10_04245 [Candidatus Uhrbacteria bacterium]|nr:hypothetical protein [Candidatus Uhrbacteria bacterium]